MTSEVVCSSENRPAWLAARRTLLGASDIASVLGLSPWRPAIDTWARKTAKVEDELPEDMSEPMELGLELEPFLLQALQNRSGCPVTRSGVLLRSVEHPHLGATQDGSVEARAGTPLARSVPGVVGRTGTVEVKTAGGGFADQWETHQGYRDVALVPAWYLPQVDCQLLVTGAPFAVFAALLGGRGFRFRWTVVLRDEVRLAELAQRTKHWWDKHVVADVPPEPDGSEAAADLIARLYPDRGGIIQLHEEHDDLVTDLLKLKAERKAIDHEIALRDQRLRMFMGGAATGELPSGRKVTLREQTRKSYTVQETSFRVLRLPKEK